MRNDEKTLLTIMLMGGTPRLAMKMGLSRKRWKYIRDKWVDTDIAFEFSLAPWPMYHLTDEGARLARGAAIELLGLDEE